jgi:hypothetical protein
MNLSAGEIYVNADFAGTSTGSLSNPYKTISEGITNAEISDTIRIIGRVSSVPYDENVTINKNLIIEGYNGGNSFPIIDVASTTEIAFTINSLLVTISNLTFSNSAENGGSSVAIYINIAGSITISIEGCTFKKYANAIKIDASIDNGGIEILGNAIFIDGIDANGIGIKNESTSSINIDADDNYWGIYDPDIIENDIVIEGMTGSATTLWKPFRDSTFLYTFNPDTGPTDVYVSMGYGTTGSNVRNVGDPNGAIVPTPMSTEGLYWQWNAFYSIQDGINAVK